MRSSFVLNIILILSTVLWKNYVTAMPQQQNPPVLLQQQQPQQPLPQQLPNQQQNNQQPQQLPNQQQWAQYQQWLQQQKNQQQQGAQQQQQQIQNAPQIFQQPVEVSMVPSSQDSILIDEESYRSKFEGLRILKVKRNDPFMKVFGDDTDRARQYVNREWRRIMGLYYS